MSRAPRGPKPPKTTADAYQQAQRDILATILRIPRGKVASYGQVAFAAGWPGRARLVAQVLGNVPGEIGPIPWQRVINAQGKIAIPKTSPSHNKQIRLLKAEGVVFLNGRVSFTAHGWLADQASPLLD